MKKLDAFIVADDKISFGESETALDHFSFAPRSSESGATAALLDLDTTGTFIACAASAVNFALAHPRLAPAVLADLPRWLPTPPASVRSAQLALLQDDLPVAVGSALRDFGLHLRLALKATRRLNENEKPANVSAADVLDELASLWGLLCERTITLLDMLKPFASPQAERRLAHDGEPMSERLLAAAALGHWPCVDGKGAIILPGWIERRSERRHNVRIDCRIIESSREWMAQTANISLTGVGLVEAPPLLPGTRAILAIGAMTEMSGVVVWGHGDRIGFRFDRPLSSLADLGRSLVSK